MVLVTIRAVVPGAIRADSGSFQSARTHCAAFFCFGRLFWSRKRSLPQSPGTANAPPRTVPTPSRVARVRFPSQETWNARNQKKRRRPFRDLLQVPGKSFQASASTSSSRRGALTSPSSVPFSSPQTAFASRRRRVLRSRRRRRSGRPSLRPARTPRRRYPRSRGRSVCQLAHRRGRFRGCYLCGHSVG